MDFWQTRKHNKRWGMSLMEDKMNENRLLWFQHVQPRPINAAVQKSDGAAKWPKCRPTNDWGRNLRKT
jgi:hypothetical protein